MTTSTLERPRGVTPARSLAQRHDALECANIVRAYRAKLKRDIHAGRVSVRDVLRDPHPHVETMHVYNLLIHMPKHGRVKVTQILNRCRIAPSKTIGGLSPRQRDELVRLLRR